MNTAIVIGATGLVGSHLVRFLMKDDRFSIIKIFTRRKTGLLHPKVEEHIINFDNPEEWSNLVTGDVLFSTLGTTLKQAGSKEAQFQIDYTYQYWFADFASKRGVPVYVLVSSAGASTNSFFFYSQMKGQLEKDVKQLPFRHTYILKPSVLEGERKAKRPNEKTGIKILKSFNKLGLVKKYRPIHGKIVAKAMINTSFLNFQNPGIFELDEIFVLAEGQVMSRPYYCSKY